MRSGDIRDQSRKLSEIAQDFERFSPSQILGGRPQAIQKLCPHYHPFLATRRLGKNL